MRETRVFNPELAHQYGFQVKNYPAKLGNMSNANQRQPLFEPLPVEEEEKGSVREELSEKERFRNMLGTYICCTYDSCMYNMYVRVYIYMLEGKCMHA